MKSASIIVPLSAALAVSLSACVTTPDTPETEFNRLAVQTESEIKLAESTGFLWRDTEQLLADARTARIQGRQEEALGLLRHALKQAQLAQQQARDNANAGPHYSR